MHLAVTLKFRSCDAFVSLPIISGKLQQLSVVTRLGVGRFAAQIRHAKGIFLFPKNVQPWCEAHSSS